MWCILLNLLGMGCLLCYVWFSVLLVIWLAGCCFLLTLRCCLRLLLCVAFAGVLVDVGLLVSWDLRVVGFWGVCIVCCFVLGWLWFGLC